MQKLPNGITNYEEMVKYNCYYVDKTEYIEKLENLNNRRVMFLRPRKFGKTLFTSTLEYYYDVDKKDKFEELFKNTYIGKNPTPLRNSYYMIHFDFSGINTSSVESTIESFKDEVISAIEVFAGKYGLDFHVDKEKDAERILNDLFAAFSLQKKGENIYVIIDEYDHFANELLSFDKNKFDELITGNGRVRKWYEVLKKAGNTVVERVFITGVAPITLDSLTSGFNVESDITRDERFNEMMGFTEEEIIKMMEAQEITKEEQEKLLPIMKENYDGYKFSRHGKQEVYNSNMSLYFLDQYVSFKRIPDKLMDINIASDYTKVENMLNLCEVEDREQIIKESLADGEVKAEITEKFNPIKKMTIDDMYSILFYLGYLTVKGYTETKEVLKIPNKVMKSLYEEYYYNLISEEIEIKKCKNEIVSELAEDGKIEKITKLVEKYLQNLSNRNFVNFNENYIKFAYSMILEGIKDDYETVLEYEVNRKYVDLIIMPREKTKEYYSVIMEFKYLKRQEEKMLKEKKKEAKEQLQEYCKLDRIKNIPKLKKYTIIAVVDKLYPEEIK